MFCTSCGTQLKDTAKFCGGCGTRVEASPTPAPARPARIELAPLASGLAECRVEIIDVESDEPDDDGEVRLTVKYTVSNETDEDWEYIETRAQLLSAAGVVIDESLDTNEQTVSAGEMQEFEVGFWGVREQLLGSPLEQAGVILSVVACGGMQHSLGEFEVPSEPFSALGLPPGQMGDAIRMLGGALWKNAPDDDGDCSVTVKLLVQNLTAHSVPELKLLAPVTDRQGREVVEAGTSDVLRPGAVAVIAGSGYAREKKFADAKVEVGIRAYPALAAGICQRDDSLPATPSLPASFGPEVMRPYAKALSTSDEIGHLMYEDCEVFYVSLNRYARDRYELVLDLRLREDFDDPNVWIYLEDNERVDYAEQANKVLKRLGAYEALGLRNEMVDRCRFILDQDSVASATRSQATESSAADDGTGGRTVRVYGNMEWFEVAEQPPGFEDLPEEFSEAYALWEQDPAANEDRILALLSPFVTALFLPSNISNWEQIFGDPDASGLPEYTARAVRLLGVDFEHTPIPSCSAEAIFDVVVTDGFDEVEDLLEWQENNDQFNSGIIFGWDVPRTDDTEDLDLKSGNHSGCECVVGFDGEGF